MENSASPISKTKGNEEQVRWATASHRPHSPWGSKQGLDVERVGGEPRVCRSAPTQARRPRGWPLQLQARAPHGWNPGDGTVPEGSWCGRMALSAVPSQLRSRFKAWEGRDDRSQSVLLPLLRSQRQDQ